MVIVFNEPAINENYYLHNWAIATKGGAGSGKGGVESGEWGVGSGEWKWEVGSGEYMFCKSENKSASSAQKSVSSAGTENDLLFACFKIVQQFCSRR
jgi:hypothetical protein